MEASPKKVGQGSGPWQKQRPNGKAGVSTEAEAAVEDIPRRSRIPWRKIASLPPLVGGQVHVLRARNAGPEVLRDLLGRYLERAPDQLPLVGTDRDRPILAMGEGEPPIHFDHACRGPVDLFAFSRTGPLGLALEQISPVDPGEAADRLSPVERTALLHLPPGLREEAFHQCWARKIALVRAVDSEPEAAPCDFDVSVTPGAPPRVHRWLRGDPRDWTLLHLRPGPGHVGAAAVLGNVSDLHTFSWEPAPADGAEKP